MTIEITIEVDHYRPVYVDDSSKVLLQSPVSPERQQRNTILVRRDQGQFKNEVSFKVAPQVDRVSGGSHTTYAHGVLIQSNSDRGYCKGDRVWLTETASEEKNVSVQDQTRIAAVNLRTWAPMTVALGDVCWIPKFRKIDCGEGEEELLTISGPPVRKQDRKIYLLTIVQRLRLSHDITTVEGVELREIVEQDSFKYQNLTALPDGKRKTSELFHRSLAAVAPTFFETAFQNSTAAPSNPVMPQSASTPEVISLVTPPPEEELPEDTPSDFSIGQPLTEGEDDPNVREKIQKLQRVVKAKKARKHKPLIPAGPVGQPRPGPHSSPPRRNKKRVWRRADEKATTTTGGQPLADVCNLGDRCPTPHRVFFYTNRPCLENPYPRHHHRPDNECPIGAAHAIHCVFRFLPGKRDVADKRLCIVPATVRHHCCETNARPANKTFHRRPEMMIDGPACGTVQVTGGRGTISMVDDSREPELEEPGIPVEVQPMPFVPDRDLDELGRKLYGYEEEAGAIGDGDEDVQLFPGNYVGDYDCGEDDENADECCLRYILGFTKEHEQVHRGRLCVRASFPDSPPASAGKSPQLGSADSLPIILDELQVEAEPDVFGDRHFCGDDEFDAEMELYDI